MVRLMRGCDALQSHADRFVVEFLVRSTSFGNDLEEVFPGSDIAWLDAEGGSFIATLRKAWTDDAPHSLVALLILLVVRVEVGGLGPEPSEKDAASIETAALAVAHLLPVMVRCA